MSPLTAAQERALKAGDSFKEGVDCPEMIVVPAGSFLMGSPEGQGDEDEHPQQEVMITRPFAVAKFALTFDKWDACAAGGGCRSDVSDSGWGRGRRPAINVSWDDAQAYVKWLSRITGKAYRLLSEAEYEYAARAGTRTAYPWGDDIKLNGKAMANCDGCGSQWDGMQTAPVGGRFAANRLVSTTWSATSGSGRRIAGTRATTGRRQTAPHGPAAIAVAASAAAVPGTAIQATSARRTAAGLLRQPVQLPRLPGRPDAYPLALYLLNSWGPGAKPRRAPTSDAIDHEFGSDVRLSRSVHWTDARRFFFER